MTDFVAIESRDPIRIRPPLAAGHMHSSKYRPAEGLVEAADTAMLLGVPLLLTGEPGTGKTKAAFWLAQEVGLELLRFDTKSTSVGRDLLYRFDEVARFRDASAGELRPTIDYIRFGALGKAILRAAGEGAVLCDVAGKELSSESFVRAKSDMEKAFGKGVASGSRACVGDLAGEDRRFKIGASEHSLVLVDEFDKAPRDAPNDLLAEIENMGFAIPELGVSVSSPKDLRPVVVITSNSEKSLPEPFLRRCAFFDIPFPSDDDELSEIVAGAIDELEGGDRLVASAIRVFRAFRSTQRIRKKPGISELLAWIEVLNKRERLSNSDTLEAVLSSAPDALDATLPAILKTSDDQSEGRATLKLIAERG